MIKEFFKKLFSMPIFLLDIWGILNSIAINYLSQLIGLPIFPAPLLGKKNKYNDDEAYKNYQRNIPDLINAIERSSNHKLSVEQITVKTVDGAKLSTVEILNKKGICPYHQKPYVINFLGNFACFEKPHVFIDLVNEAWMSDFNVIGFNFRGVMGSEKPTTNNNRVKGPIAQALMNILNRTKKPTPADDLVKDGIAQVQRVLDKGVPPGHIVLNGFSIGAAVATLVAKHFHDKGIKIYLFNGISFSTLTDVIVGKMSKLLGKLAKPFIKYLLAKTGWEIDAASAYQGLPATHKDHIVIVEAKEAILDKKQIQQNKNKQSTFKTLARCHKFFKSRGLEGKDSQNIKNKLKEMKRELDEMNLTKEGTRDTRDDMISASASLHKSTLDKKQIQQNKDEQNKLNTLARCHNFFKHRGLEGKDSQKIDEKLYKMQQALDDRVLTENEMWVKDLAKASGHSTDSNNLVNKNGQTARERFVKFVKDHCPKPKIIFKKKPSNCFNLSSYVSKKDRYDHKTNLSSYVSKKDRYDQTTHYYGSFTTFQERRYQKWPRIEEIDYLSFPRERFHIL